MSNVELTIFEAAARIHTELIKILGTNVEPEHAADTAVKLYLATMFKVAEKNIVANLDKPVFKMPKHSFEAGQSLSHLMSSGFPPEKLMLNLEMPVTVLKLSPRMKSSFIRQFKTTDLSTIKLKHITSLSENYIRHNWMNFGEGSIKELKDLLMPFGLYLKKYDI